MGQQIIKQPNGKYAVFSSVVDAFVLYDATPEEIRDEWVAAERRRLDARIAEICNALEVGGKPYYQFTMTWDEALAEHEKRHGKLEAGR